MAAMRNLADADMDRMSGAAAATQAGAPRDSGATTEALDLRREPASPGAVDHVMSMPLFPEPAELAAPAGKRPIAVIGAGFSGTIAALQLLRRLPQDQPVLLCERSPEFARGIAYATGDNNHLLNVRAANMSALSDEPLHFQDWLKRRALEISSTDGLHDTAAGLFASRGLYGQYLRSILDYVMRETAGHAQLRLMPDDVLDVLSAEHGGYELVCASGQRLAVVGVVLAVGNLPHEESDGPQHLPQRLGRESLAPARSRPPGAGRRHRADHGGRRHLAAPARLHRRHRGPVARRAAAVAPRRGGRPLAHAAFHHGRGDLAAAVDGPPA